MSSSNTTTRYGVTHTGDNKLIGETYTDVDDARGALANVQQTMISLQLEPDVQLVSVDYTNTIADPVPYVDPEPTTDTEADATDEPEPTTSVTTPASTVATSDDTNPDDTATA